MWAKKLLITRPHNPGTSVMSPKISGKTRESVGADIFTINNKHYHSTVDYHRKFLIMNQLEGFSADNLIKTCKIIFSEYGLASKILSDTGTHFMLEILRSSAKGLAVNRRHHHTATRAMDKQKHT